MHFCYALLPLQLSNDGKTWCRAYGMDLEALLVAAKPTSMPASMDLLAGMDCLLRVLVPELAGRTLDEVRKDAKCVFL